MKKIRLALASPKITLCDTEKNAKAIIKTLKSKAVNAFTIYVWNF